MTARTRGATRLPLFLALAGLLIAGCSGGSTRSGNLSASLPVSSPRSAAGTRLVVIEFHGSYSVLLSLAPERPADRRTLLRLDHAPNYAPRAALSPAGETVAYTVLPTGARTPDTEASLWLVNLDDRTPRRLAERLDLRVTPVWSPDGKRIAVQRLSYGGAAGVESTLLTVDAQSGVMVEAARATGSERLYPAGFTPDAGALYYVRYSKAGAFLESVDLQGRAARRIARVGDGAVRDVRIAPDGSRAALLALEGSPATYHAVGVNLATGDVSPLLPELTRAEDVGVAWKPQTPPAVAVGLLAPDGATGAVSLTDGSSGIKNTQGFDVPVSWSPDGRLLFVRSFSGSTADDPGREEPLIIDSEGVRRSLAVGSPVEFVGWSDHGP